MHKLIKSWSCISLSFFSKYFLQIHKFCNVNLWKKWVCSNLWQIIFLRFVRTIFWQLCIFCEFVIHQMKFCDLTQSRRKINEFVWSFWQFLQLPKPQVLFDALSHVDLFTFKCHNIIASVMTFFCRSSSLLFGNATQLSWIFSTQAYLTSNLFPKWILNSNMHFCPIF